MILAVIPYAALQVDRAVRFLLRGRGGVLVVVALLGVAAAIPLAIEGARNQPIAQSVDDLRDGTSALNTWMRMEGRIVTLSSPESVAGGQQVFSLLIEESGDAILLIANRTLDNETMVTGHLSSSAGAEQSARNVGGPRVPDEELEIIDRYSIHVDNEIVPPSDRDWALVWIALVTAGLLLVGRIIGYPIVRIGREGVAPQVPPMAEGESLAVRVVDVEEETALGLRAPRGTFTRPPRTSAADPSFVLTVTDGRRPVLFHGHQWSRAIPGRLWTVLDGARVVKLYDFGVEVLVAVGDESSQERLLATYARSGVPAPAAATGG